MTLDEAIEQFKYDAECNRADLDLSFAEDNDKAAEWLKELKQYRAIGTVEECRAAVERQIPDKPQKVLLSYGTGYECKQCGNELSVNAFNGEYCHWCGQKLDWSDKDDT